MSIYGDEFQYCDLCSCYSTNTQLFRSMDGSTYRLCRGCVEMVCDSEPIDEDIPQPIEAEDKDD